MNITNANTTTPMIKFVSDYLTSETAVLLSYALIISIPSLRSFRILDSKYLILSENSVIRDKFMFLIYSMYRRTLAERVVRPQKGGSTWYIRAGLSVSHDSSSVE